MKTVNLEVGQKIIYNSNYIDELNRHVDIWQQRVDVEYIPSTKAKYQAKLDKLKAQLEKALDFQGTIVSIKYPDIPQLTSIEVADGTQISAKYIMVL